MKMVNVQKIIAFILILAMIMTFSGCETYNNFKKAFIDPPVEEAKVIKVGILEPKTGRQSYDAEDEIAGMELAHEIFSSVGGIKIELVYADNRSSVDESLIAAKTLVDAGVVCVLGSVSSTLSLAASDTLKNASIPAIAATNTVNILTSTNEFYFRACYTEDFEEQCAADFVISKIRNAELSEKQKTLSRGQTAEISQEELLSCIQSKAAIIVTSASGLTEAQLFEEQINSRFGVVTQTQNQNTITVYTLPDDPAQYEYFLASIADEKGTDAAIYFPVSMETAETVIEKSTSCFAFAWEDFQIINDADEDGVYDEGEYMYIGRSLVQTTEPAVYGFTFVGNSNWDGIKNFENVYYTSNYAVDKLSDEEMVYTGNTSEDGLPELISATGEKSEIQRIFESAYIAKYGKTDSGTQDTNYPGNSETNSGNNEASASGGSNGSSDSAGGDSANSASAFGESDNTASSTTTGEAQNSSEYNESSALLTQDEAALSEENKILLSQVSDSFKLGFDSYYILYKALEKIDDINSLVYDDGTVNGSYLHTLIAETSGLVTLTKTINFNSYGDPLRQVYVYGLAERQEQVYTNTGSTTESSSHVETDAIQSSVENTGLDQQGLENLGITLYDENGNEIIIDTRVYTVVYVSTPNS